MILEKIKPFSWFSQKIKKLNRTGGKIQPPDICIFTFFYVLWRDRRL
jgi:hypothetical protein